MELTAARAQLHGMLLPVGVPNACKIVAERSIPAAAAGHSEGLQLHTQAARQMLQDAGGQGLQSQTAPRSEWPCRAGPPPAGSDTALQPTAAWWTARSPLGEAPHRYQRQAATAVKMQAETGGKATLRFHK